MRVEAEEVIKFGVEPLYGLTLLKLARPKLKDFANRHQRRDRGSQYLRDRQNRYQFKCRR